MAEQDSSVYRPCAKCGGIEQYANSRCRVCRRAIVMAHAKANPDKIKERGESYRHANHEKEKLRNAAWRKANPEARRIATQNRNAYKRENGGKLSKGLAEKLFELQKGKCACCNQPLGDSYHLDHVMPIKLGGMNIDDNIQLLRPLCNNQKHAKHPIDYMQSKGFLL